MDEYPSTVTTSSLLVRAGSPDVTPPYSPPGSKLKDDGLTCDGPALLEAPRFSPVGLAQLPRGPFAKPGDPQAKEEKMGDHVYLSEQTRMLENWKASQEAAQKLIKDRNLEEKRVREKQDRKSVV